MLRSGELVGTRFEIDCQVGSGGMGAVYRARDTSSGNLVALKILHRDRSMGDDEERFAREAQLLSEFRHPCIVSHVAHGQLSQGHRFSHESQHAGGPAWPHDHSYRMKLVALGKTTLGLCGRDQLVAEDPFEEVGVLQGRR